MFKVKKFLSLTLLMVVGLVGMSLPTGFSVAQSYGTVFNFKMPNEPVYLYAEIDSNPYTIHFDGNGGIGTMDSISTRYDKYEKLSANSFTKDGYAFKGWSSSRTGAVEHLDQSWVRNLIDTGEITLYAQRDTIVSYTIQYLQENLTGGGYTIAETSTEYGVVGPLVIMTGKSYTGFSLQTGFVGYITSGGIIGYHYIRNSYRLTVVDEDRDNQVLVDVLIKYGASITPILPTSLMTGWTGNTFSGWNNVPSDGLMPAHDLKITSEWIYGVHSITFNTDGGSEVTTITGNYGDPVTIPPNPTRTGYTFIGWSPDIPPNIPKSDVVVSAQWKPKVYSITFNTHGGSEVTTITGNYGDPVPIPPNPTRNGYEFVKWSPDIPSRIPSHNMMINAVWEKIKDGGSGGGGGGGGGSSGGGGKNGKGSKISTGEDIPTRTILTGGGDNQHGSSIDEDKPGGNATNPYTLEVMIAYMWAYKKGIVNTSLENSNPDGYVSRGDMAEMVVKFTENVVGKKITKIPTRCRWGDAASEWKSREAIVYAEKACALGVMGIRVKEFMPNKYIDRAEFGTILSRLLWGNKYDVVNATKTNAYYTRHLEALNKAGIMKQIDNPISRNELRKWAWLMLMRVKTRLYSDS